MTELRFVLHFTTHTGQVRINPVNIYVHHLVKLSRFLTKTISVVCVILGK